MSWVWGSAKSNYSSTGRASRSSWTSGIKDCRTAFGQRRQSGRKQVRCILLREVSILEQNADDILQAERGDTVNIPKKWFARAMCASTIQSYHFARIQLLANKPHLSTGLPYSGLPTGSGVHTSSLAQRHASYATILNQSRKHAEDIVSISLALTNDSARIHSVQPLYTAGQVLGNGEDGNSKAVDKIRICILDLLTAIQREAGWATEYRMRHLLEQWGLPARERFSANALGSEQ